MGAQFLFGEFMRERQKRNVTTGNATKWPLKPIKLDTLLLQPGVSCFFVLSENVNSLFTTDVARCPAKIESCVFQLRG